MDNHEIWRVVGANAARFEALAPEGYETVVEVFLVGRPEPVRLAQVQTTRDQGFPWALLISLKPDEPKRAPDTEHVILVPESHVDRIEIRVMRSEGSAGLGFTHLVVEEPMIGNNDE